MTRRLLLVFAFVLMLALVPVATPPAAAQVSPEILTFELVDADPVLTVNALENGSASVDVIYEVSTLAAGQGVMFYGRVAHANVPLLDAPLTDEVGVVGLTLLHPLDFDAPAITMAILNANGVPLGTAMRPVFYNPGPDDDAMEIASFSADATSIDVNELASGDATLELQWDVQNRDPNTNLRFIQVYDDRFASSVERPRRFAYVTSQGLGIATPFFQPGIEVVRIVVQVFDVRTGDVLVAELLRLPVTGTLTVTPAARDDASTTVAPPAPDTTAPPPPPDTPDIPLQEADPIEGAGDDDAAEEE
jgi:hypothetical protein